MLQLRTHANALAMSHDTVSVMTLKTSLLNLCFWYKICSQTYFRLEAQIIKGIEYIVLI